MAAVDHLGHERLDRRVARASAPRRSNAAVLGHDVRPADAAVRSSRRWPSSPRRCARARIAAIALAAATIALRPSSGRMPAWAAAPRKARLQAVVGRRGDDDLADRRRVVEDVAERRERSVETSKALAPLSAVLLADGEEQLDADRASPRPPRGARAPAAPPRPPCCRRRGSCRPRSPSRRRPAPARRRRRAGTVSRCAQSSTERSRAAGDARQQVAALGAGLGGRVVLARPRGRARAARRRRGRPSRARARTGWGSRTARRTGRSAAGARPPRPGRNARRRSARRARRGPRRPRARGSRARSSAAATNSRNSGAGRSGRDLNSGWNCEATKNGWSRSSMTSTRRSSGDVPETTSPAASRRLRSEIDTS